MNSGLEVIDISKFFDGVQSLDSVSLSVSTGNLDGLIGSNGAGKTTLFNIVAGEVHQDSGTVKVDGEIFDGYPTFLRAQKGIARTFQKVQVFGDLSVLEHVAIAIRARLLSHKRMSTVRYVLNMFKNGDVTCDEAEEIFPLLRELGIESSAKKLVKTLSLGNIRMVELARALALRPKVLLLDEPSSGMDEFEISNFIEVVTKLKIENSCAILIVEHDIGLIKRLTDNVTVLDAGKVLASGKTQEVLEYQRVKELFSSKRQ